MSDDTTKAEALAADSAVSRLRDALAAGPTEGPWEVLDGTRVGVTLPSLADGCGYDSHCVALTHGAPRLDPQTNAAYIAACDPATIRTVLDALAAAQRERDEARNALSSARAYLVDTLALELCEKDGNDDPHHLLWEGGPVPEPWGEVWEKYRPEAARLVGKALETASKWGEAEDAYVAELHDDCIRERDEAIAERDTLRARIAELEADQAGRVALTDESQPPKLRTGGWWALTGARLIVESRHPAGMTTHRELTDAERSEWAAWLAGRAAVGGEG